MEKLLIDNFDGNQKLDAILTLMIDIRANQELLSDLFRTVSLQNQTQEKANQADIVWDENFVTERRNILRSLESKYQLGLNFLARYN